MEGAGPRLPPRLVLQRPHGAGIWRLALKSLTHTVKWDWTPNFGLRGKTKKDQKIPNSGARTPISTTLGILRNAVFKPKDLNVTLRVLPDNPGAGFDPSKR